MLVLEAQESVCPAAPLGRSQALPLALAALATAKTAGEISGAGVAPKWPADNNITRTAFRLLMPARVQHRLHYTLPMADSVYNRATLGRYAKHLLGRAKLVTFFGFVIGGALGVAVCGSGAFVFKFVTSLRFTLHTLIPGLNVEQAAQVATVYATTCGLVGGLSGAIIGALRGSNIAAGYKLAAQQALCQVEIERHLATLAGRGGPIVDEVQPGKVSSS